MEYCAGGSVYKMLEDPVNMYGLLEDEFLVFLRDISTSCVLLYCLSLSNGLCRKELDRQLTN